MKRLASGNVRFTATQAVQTSRTLCAWVSPDRTPKDVVVSSRPSINGVYYDGPSCGIIAEVSRILTLQVEVSRGGVTRRSWVDAMTSFTLQGVESVTLGLAAYPTNAAQYDVQAYGAIEESQGDTKEPVASIVIRTAAAEGVNGFDQLIPYPCLPKWAQVSIYGYQGALNESDIRAYAYGEAQATYVEGWQVQQVGHGMAISEAWGVESPWFYVDATAAAREHVSVLRMGIDL